MQMPILTKSLASGDLAVELSTKCISERSGRLHPKVGAVVVKNGQVVVSAYRNEMGHGDHAEYIALERKGRGSSGCRGRGFDYHIRNICTRRSHDKRPCTLSISPEESGKSGLERLTIIPGVAGLGEIEAQKDGIRIGKVAQMAFAERILRDDGDLFEEIEKKQPVISHENQKHERDLIIESLRDSVHLSSDFANRLVDDSLRSSWSQRSKNGLLKIAGENLEQAEKLKAAMNRALVAQTNDAFGWIRLADYLAEIGESRLASLAYSIATRIDATIERGWSGLAKSELNDNIHDLSWPYVASTQPMDKSPRQLHSLQWVKLAEHETKTATKLKAIYRASPLGNRSQELWDILTKLFLEENTWAPSKT